MIILHKLQGSFLDSNEARNWVRGNLRNSRLHRLSHALLIMVHCRAEGRYYVVEDRMTGSEGWLEPYEAKAKMLNYIDDVA